MELLDAAESAVARGDASPEVTIVIRQDGGIHMLSECDWPLDSLAAHHGARAVYRIRTGRDSAEVEGRGGGSTCVMRSETPNPRKFLKQLDYFRG